MGLLTAQRGKDSGFHRLAAVQSRLQELLGDFLIPAVSVHTTPTRVGRFRAESKTASEIRHVAAWRISISNNHPGLETLKRIQLPRNSGSVHIELGQKFLERGAPREPHRLMPPRFYPFVPDHIF